MLPVYIWAWECVGSKVRDVPIVATEAKALALTPFPFLPLK
jgi:hypothetical protein